MAHPVISGNERRIEYPTLVATSEFAGFDDPVASADDISVYVNDVLEPGATVSGTASNGLIENWTVTLPAPVTGTVVILGDRTPRRATDFVSTAPVSQDSLNTALDTLTLSDREISAEVKRGVRVPSHEGMLNVLPAAALRADRLLTFDDSGQVEMTALKVSEIASMIASPLPDAMYYFPTMAGAIEAQNNLPDGAKVFFGGYAVEGDTAIGIGRKTAAAQPFHPDGGKIRPEQIGGRFNGQWWGAIPDNSGPHQTQFQQMSDFLRAYPREGAMYLPGSENQYVFTRPFVRWSNQTWLGDGGSMRQGRTRLISSAGSFSYFWRNGITLDGTFFGEKEGEEDQSVFRIPIHVTGDAMQASATTILGCAGHSVEPGNVICLSSVAVKEGTFYSEYATLRVVEEVTEDSIELDEPIYQNMTGGCEIRIVPTDPDDDLTAANQINEQYTGRPYVAYRLVTRNIKFGHRGNVKSTPRQTVHVSCFDSEYSDCMFEGGLSGIGGNPFLRMIFDRNVVIGQHRTAEFAYLTGETTANQCRFHTIESVTIPPAYLTGGGYSKRGSTESNPGRFYLVDCTVTWGPKNAGANQFGQAPPALDLQGANCGMTRGTINAGEKEKAFTSAGAGATLKGVEVNGGTISGIATTRDDAIVTDCHIRPLPNGKVRTKAAIEVGGRSGTATGNNLGGYYDGFILATDLRDVNESDLAVAGNTGIYGLNDRRKDRGNYVVSQTTVTPADAHSGKSRVFVSESALMPATPGMPTGPEIAAYAAANTLTDVVLTYSGYERDDGEYRRQYFVDGDGEVERVDGVAVPVSDSGDMTIALLTWNGIQFVTDTALGPATAGDPTEAEISAHAAGKVNTVYRYNGTDTDNAEEGYTHIFHIAFDGTCTRIYTATGDVTPDTEFRLETTIRITATGAPNAKYLHVDMSIFPTVRADGRISTVLNGRIMSRGKVSLPSRPSASTRRTRSSASTATSPAMTASACGRLRATMPEPTRCASASTCPAAAVPRSPSSSPTTRSRRRPSGSDDGAARTHDPFRNRSSRSCGDDGCRGRGGAG